MGQAVGAATIGEGWTQMMPLGWLITEIWLAARVRERHLRHGKRQGRYVDESAERDVLSEGGF